MYQHIIWISSVIIKNRSLFCFLLFGRHQSSFSRMKKQKKNEWRSFRDIFNFSFLREISVGMLYVESFIYDDIWLHLNVFKNILPLKWFLNDFFFCKTLKIKVAQFRPIIIAKWLCIYQITHYNETFVRKRWSNYR